MYMAIQLPQADITLHCGDLIYLGEYGNIPWVLEYGWYEYGGNRETCGWYIVPQCLPDSMTSHVTFPKLRPLFKSDLCDIFKYITK